MWIYADNQKRILGYSTNNMFGNTGWQDVLEEVPDVLTNEHGVPLYELVDGQITPRSQEDVDADYVPPEPVPPLEDRVDAVEIKTGDLEEALDMILSGVTE